MATEVLVGETDEYTDENCTIEGSFIIVVIGVPNTDDLECSKDEVGLADSVTDGIIMFPST